MKMIRHSVYFLIWFVINKVVANIPIWPLRKLLLKMFGLKIGKNSRIGLGVIIQSPWKLVVGANTVINENAFIDARGGLIIGDNVSISYYAKLISASHDFNSPDFRYIENSLSVEDNCWIAVGAVVLDGSVLKKGAVIGAGAVFKGIAQSSSVYAGNPATRIKSRILDPNFNQNVTYSLV